MELPPSDWYPKLFMSKYKTGWYARLYQDPKRTHEIAVKKIFRYLQRTGDRGIVINQDDAVSLDCFVDEDFCGLCFKDTAVDSISVKHKK